MINKKKVMKEIMSWTFSLLIAFFISVMLNSKVVAKVRVQQSSMESTLYSNQQLIVDKLSYNFTSPKRGDIIIFLDKERNKGENSKTERLVKRVIGIPGDEIDIKNGYVYVNGEKLNETYVKGETLSENIKLPIKVGDNQLFVLGDNRQVSLDSRVFGSISYNQVEGKAILRVFPFDEIGTIK